MKSLGVCSYVYIAILMFIGEIKQLVTRILHTYIEWYHTLIQADDTCSINYN